jgi:hypothetical protein
MLMRCLQMQHQQQLLMRQGMSKQARRALGFTARVRRKKAQCVGIDLLVGWFARMPQVGHGLKGCAQGCT